jgi:hypothetical protein
MLQLYIIVWQSVARACVWAAGPLVHWRHVFAGATGICPDEPVTTVLDSLPQAAPVIAAVCFTTG